MGLTKYRKNQLTELFEVYVETPDSLSVSDNGSIEITKGTTWKWLAKILGNYQQIGFIDAAQSIIAGMKANPQLRQMLNDETEKDLLIKLIKPNAENASDAILDLYTIHLCANINGMALPVQYGNDPDNLILVTVNTLVGDSNDVLNIPAVRSAITKVSQSV